jgi:hypothetical protein
MAMEMEAKSPGMLFCPVSCANAAPENKKVVIMIRIDFIAVLLVDGKSKSLEYYEILLCTGVGSPNFLIWQKNPELMRPQ